MSDRIADLEATIRAAIGAGDRLVPGTMSEAEFDALPAIAELVEIAARAVRAEAERDAAQRALAAIHAEYPNTMRHMGIVGHAP